MGDNFMAARNAGHSGPADDRAALRDFRADLFFRLDETSSG